MDTKVARHLRALRWHGIYMDTQVARHLWTLKWHALHLLHILYKCDLQLIYSHRASRSLPGQIPKYCFWLQWEALFRSFSFPLLNPLLGTENGPIWDRKRTDLGGQKGPFLIPFRSNFWINNVQSIASIIQHITCIV